MALERFQEETVRAAVVALTNPNGSRRFLIADEVGLGKTVCAKAIAAEMQEGRRRPLNVVYLCPNLDIASQNLTKLRALEQQWGKPEDRLSLVLRELPSKERLAFRVYCYTPETSLPGWKAGVRTGRYAERDLIAELLRELAPRLWKRVRAIENTRREDGGSTWFPAHLGKAPCHLLRPFEASLRELMELRGKPLDEGLVSWLVKRGDDVPELILRARAALALAALRHPAGRPDLLILDEFHRYADLIVRQEETPKKDVDAERLAVHRTLVDALVGTSETETRPALLLLSATPYRLHRLDRGEMAGGRYAHFSRLVRFLHGQVGAGRSAQIEAAIAAHHAALSRRDDVGEALVAVAEAKRLLEDLLRPVIARTERATAIAGELFDRCERPARVEPRDLVTFRHLAHAVDEKAKPMRSWVQPLWSSVPYPAETLFNYALCKALGRNLPSVTMTGQKSRPAHPQLRSLVEGDNQPQSAVSCEALALPWLAPTRPWWPLGGRWHELEEAGRLHGKTLLFSRFRGTPASVSTWLSNEVDRQSSRQKGKGKFVAQAYLRPDAKAPWPLIALFMPWPKLSRAFDPRRGEGMGINQVRRQARRDLRDWLVNEGFDLESRAGPARKPWQIAFDLESQLSDKTLITGALYPLRNFIKPQGWRRSDAPRGVTRQEVVLLADYLLESPGAVLARSMLRHQPEALVDTRVFADLFRFSWRQLRQYFGQRYFASVILGSRRRRRGGGYPEALRRAIVEGGLEATLDEHLAVMKLIGDGGPLRILEQSLIGRPGLTQRRTTRGIRRARVHAAAPYLGADRKSVTRSDRQRGKSDEKLRSDMLRKGFNSPFWPHVLATTSIGQEGLDFHVWCDRVVHWDLPRDPVDFEQREGRIARYASLGVRRALAEKFGGGDLPNWKSPFWSIFEAARSARREGLGLERWWSPAGHRPISVTFSLPFSLTGVRLGRLREDLVRYRLALGQPEPQLFEAMIEHFGLDQEQARCLALNLSPAAAPSKGAASEDLIRPEQSLHGREDNRLI